MRHRTTTVIHHYPLVTSEDQFILPNVDDTSVVITSYDVRIREDVSMASHVVLSGHVQDADNWEPVKFEYTLGQYVQDRKHPVTDPWVQAAHHCIAIHLAEEVERGETAVHDLLQ